MLKTFYIFLTDLPSWMLVALGFYVAYRVLKFPDLTVDASFIIGTCATAYAAGTYQSTSVGILTAVVLASILSLFTSAIYLINPKPSYKLLAGTLVLFFSYSINYRVLGYATEKQFHNETTFFNNLALFEMNSGNYILRPITVGIGLLVVLAVAAFYIWFLKTNLGVLLRTVGTRRDIMRTGGAPTARYLITGLVITNATVAIGGWYHASLNCFAQVSLFGTIIHALASAILGEIIIMSFKRLKDKRASVKTIIISPLIGAFAYHLIRTFVQSLFISDFHSATGTFSVNQQDFNIIVSAIVILIIIAVRYFIDKPRHEEQSNEDFV